MAEHPPVKRQVAGSSPALGAAERAQLKGSAQRNSARRLHGPLRAEANGRRYLPSREPLLLCCL